MMKKPQTPKRKTAPVAETDASKPRGAKKSARDAISNPRHREAFAALLGAAAASERKTR
jgi:hypothetical protein